MIHINYILDPRFTNTNGIFVLTFKKLVILLDFDYNDSLDKYSMPLA